MSFRIAILPETGNVLVLEISSHIGLSTSVKRYKTQRNVSMLSIPRRYYGRYA